MKLKSGQAMEEGVNIDGKKLNRYNDRYTGGGDSDGKGLYSQYYDGHTGVRSYTEYYDEHIGDDKGILMVRDSTVCTTTGSRDEDSVKQSTMGLNKVQWG